MPSTQMVRNCEVSPTCHQHVCRGCEGVASLHCDCSSAESRTCHGYQDNYRGWTPYCRDCGSGDYDTLFGTINQEHEVALERRIVAEGEANMPPRRVLKGCVAGPKETKFLIWKHLAAGPDRGGLEIYVRSPAIEAWVASLSRPIAREDAIQREPRFSEAPPLYLPTSGRVAAYGEGWGSRITVSPTSVMGPAPYAASFETNAELFRQGAVNLSFLRAEGLEDGVTFKMNGVYHGSEVRAYREAVTQALRQIHDAVLKELKFTITVVTEANGVAA